MSIVTIVILALAVVLRLEFMKPFAQTNTVVFRPRKQVRPPTSPGQ